MVYLLDMTKPRWEIRVYDKDLMINNTHIKILRAGEVAQFNNHYYLATDKKQLLEVAEGIKQSNLDRLMKEVNKYEQMKIKVTRK